MTDLYRKVRPKDLDGIVGQPEVVQILKEKLANGMPHVTLLTGPSGTGKTTCARIIRDKLGCVGKDFREINCATIDSPLNTVRMLEHQSPMMPGFGKVRVYYLDEFQSLSRAQSAQQGLLKVLEDVPDWVYFLLATTDPVKIIPTIQTRCTILKFRLIPAKDMRRLLSHVCKAEGWRLDEEVVERIIECAEGSARRALKLLEQVVVLKDKDTQLNAIIRSDAKVQGVDLAKALLRETVSWKEVRTILLAVEEEPETIRRIILGFAMGAMLKRPGSRNRAYQILTSFCDHVRDSGLPGLARACYEVIESTKNE